MYALRWDFCFICFQEWEDLTELLYDLLANTCKYRTRLKPGFQCTNLLSNSWVYYLFIASILQMYADMGLTCRESFYI